MLKWLVRRHDAKKNKRMRVLRTGVVGSLAGEGGSVITSPDKKKVFRDEKQLQKRKRNPLSGLQRRGGNGKLTIKSDDYTDDGRRRVFGRVTSYELVSELRWLKCKDSCTGTGVALIFLSVPVGPHAARWCRRGDNTITGDHS